MFLAWSLLIIPSNLIDTYTFDNNQKAKRSRAAVSLVSDCRHVPKTSMSTVFDRRILFVKLRTSQTEHGYRYYKEVPVFPLGWGLSYTTYTLALDLDSRVTDPNEPLVVTRDVHVNVTVSYQRRAMAPQMKSCLRSSVR